MDGCIAEMTKLLIWSDNTYKQKKKKIQNERGRVGAGSAICSLLLSDPFSKG
jgi:hypothetical protein